MFNFMKKNKKSPAELQFEAKMKAKETVRQMDKSAAALGQAAEKIKKLIIENEKAGRHNLALQNTKAYRTITALQNKVACLSTRVQMVMEMGQITGVLNGFLESCGSMGGLLESIANPAKLMNGQADFAGALDKIDQLLYQSEMMFDDLAADDEFASVDPADEDMLKNIMASSSMQADLDALNAALDSRSKNRVKN